MVIVEFFVGCAGTGKSTLTGIYRDWLNDQTDLDAIAVNFDPGALRPPYNADVDIRDYIRIEDVMAEYKLGPNGALVASTDLTITFLNEIKAEINELRPNHIIVDTPGQMELFAFRSSGLFILASLGGQNSVMNYLVDPNLAKQPAGFFTRLRMAAFHSACPPCTASPGWSNLAPSDPVPEYRRWPAPPPVRSAAPGQA